MKVIDTGGYLKFLNCLAIALENHRFASLISVSDHLLKYVTYVTWHDK